MRCSIQLQVHNPLSDPALLVMAAEIKELELELEQLFSFVLCFDKTIIHMYSLLVRTAPHVCHRPHNMESMQTEFCSLFYDICTSHSLSQRSLSLCGPFCM